MRGRFRRPLPAVAPPLWPRYAGPRSPLPSCSRPPAAPLMSSASWGRPRPTSTPWQARGGARWAPPSEHEGEKIKPPLLEDTMSRETVTYLRVEKPRFLFLGGSVTVAAAPDVAAAAPLVASTACASATAARVTSLVGCLAAGAPTPAPGAVSSAASAALGEGAQAPTSRGKLVPHRSPPSRPMTSTPKSPGRRVPAALAAGTPHSSVPDALAAGFSSPSCAPPAPAPAAAPRACSGSERGRVGPCGVHGHTLQGIRERSDLAGASQEEWRERRRRLYSPAGPRGA
jgi:hypothetical protein